MTAKTDVSGREATDMAIEKNDVRLGNDTNMSMDATETNKPTLSAGAQRMRLHRRRRRSGLRLVSILVSSKQLESLIGKKYLDDKSRNNQAAIAEAVEWCVYDALLEPLTANAKQIGTSRASV